MSNKPPRRNERRKAREQKRNRCNLTAKLTSAATGFYLDRGIGADTILMIALVLVYGGWRAVS